MRRIILSMVILVSLVFPAVSITGHAGAVDVFNNSSCASGENVCDNVCDTSGAASSSTVCQSVNKQNQQGGNPIISIIKTAIEIISFIIGIAAIIGIVVSGIRMVASGGDSNAMASARGGLVSSLVGVAVAAVALSIVEFVLKGN
jgi:hypothetical protein